MGLMLQIDFIASKRKKGLITNILAGSKLEPRSSFTKKYLKLSEPNISKFVSLLQGENFLQDPSWLNLVLT